MSWNYSSLAIFAIIRHGNVVLKFLYICLPEGEQFSWLIMLLHCNDLLSGVHAPYQCGLGLASRIQGGSVHIDTWQESN